MQVNEDRLRHPGRHIIVADLIDHYVQTELAEQADWHSHANANCVPPIPGKVDTAALGESERVLCPNNSG
jgi:hypothetical protein